MTEGTAAVVDEEARHAAGVARTRASLESGGLLVDDELRLDEGEGSPRGPRLLSRLTFAVADRSTGRTLVGAVTVSTTPGHPGTVVEASSLLGRPARSPTDALGPNELVVGVTRNGDLLAVTADHARFEAATNAEVARRRYLRSSLDPLVLAALDEGPRGRVRSGLLARSDVLAEIGVLLDLAAGAPIEWAVRRATGGGR